MDFISSRILDPRTRNVADTRVGNDRTAKHSRYTSVCSECHQYSDERDMLIITRNNWDINRKRIAVTFRITMPIVRRGRPIIWNRQINFSCSRYYLETTVKTGFNSFQFCEEDKQSRYKVVIELHQGWANFTARGPHSTYESICEPHYSIIVILLFDYIVSEETWRSYIDMD